MSAFHFYYDWSHAVGMAETARQTAEQTGIRSGSGLVVNYLFTVIWVADAVYWWRVGLERYRVRPASVHGVLHAFFLLMVVNGTVVFGRGPVRWFGAGIVVTIAVAALMAWRGSQGKGCDKPR
jgi:pyridoxal biosynthesis lyase PdxS